MLNSSEKKTCIHFKISQKQTQIESSNWFYCTLQPISHQNAKFQGHSFIGMEMKERARMHVARNKQVLRK